MWASICFLFDLKPVKFKAIGYFIMLAQRVASSRFELTLHNNPRILHENSNL